MSLDPNSNSRGAGIHFALALLALAITFSFAAQITATSNQKKNLSWQMTNGDKQIENAKANEKKLAEIIEQQKVGVAQVVKLQTEYKNIFEELLALAEDDKDPDAKAVVKQFGIARNDKKPADKEKP